MITTDTLAAATSVFSDRAEIESVLSGLKMQTDLSCCLAPLLDALYWRGSSRHVAEAIPHFVDQLDITHFRNVLANLRYESRPLSICLDRLDPRLMPCLFLPKDGNAMVLFGPSEGGKIRIFDGGTLEEQEIVPPSTAGTAYLFHRIEDDDEHPQRAKLGWFRTVTERFLPLIYQTLAVTLILNLLVLAIPLFVMSVYDTVVATGSLSTLAYFGVGVMIAIICDALLRRVRARMLSFVGARLDTIVGSAVFQKILYLPPSVIERASIGAQVARLKDFESIRDFFTGPMVLVFFELPFVVLFIIVIAVLGGPLAFVPLIMIALFVLLGVIMAPYIRNGVILASRAGSKRQEFIIEMLGNMRAIKYCAAEEKWLERYRELSAKASLSGFYTARVGALINATSNVMMIASGLATVSFGVFLVFDNQMTIGGLIASMILVWRVLAPLQSGFISLTRLTQIKSSIRQIDNLMNIQPERDPNAMFDPMRKRKGAVEFSHVSLRYTPDSDPALIGLNLTLRPGEVVGIVGGNGSGKSTILKLLAGMYHPQAGNIRIDSLDIRQIDPIELRHIVGYVPQTCQFFYGTIAQNLRLANPVATDQELRDATEIIGLLNDIEALPNGFETRIGDANASQLPGSFQQRLNLARGFVKSPSILMFDEPGNGLDYDDDQAFMRAVESVKGKTTVLIVTHRPSHLRLVDKMIWLESGRVRAVGPAEDVRKILPKDFL